MKIFPTKTKSNEIPSISGEGAAVVQRARVSEKVLLQYLFFV